MKNKLGEILKNNRMEIGISQIKLSELTGVDHKTISLIERGIRRKPRIETLVKLSPILYCIDYKFLKIFEYTKEDIDYFAIFFPGHRFEYDFGVLITGHGSVLAFNIDEAREYANLDIDDLVKAEDFIGENQIISFDKCKKIVTSLDKEVKWKMERVFEKDFEFDEKTRKKMNERTIMVLFKILYKDGDITKKQYERLINVLKRRLSLNWIVL